MKVTLEQVIAAHSLMALGAKTFRRAVDAVWENQPDLDLYLIATAFSDLERASDHVVDLLKSEILPADVVASICDAAEVAATPRERAAVVDAIARVEGAHRCGGCHGTGRDGDAPCMRCFATGWECWTP